MRVRALLLLVLVVAASGCSGTSGTDDAPDLRETGVADVAGQMGETDMADAAPERTTTVSDEVSFTGTLGASACWFDGSTASCANVGGNNVLLYDHARKGDILAGELRVDFSPATGTGPVARVFIAEDCPGTCRLVQDLTSNGPSMQSPPVGTGGTYSLHLPAATILDNQTLVVRMSPMYVTGLASASPVYDVDLTGTLDFVVPA